jgi:acetyl esterase/lipase
VVLLLHGGGYIFETHKLHWQAAARIAGELGIPVCLPAYPLLPDSTLEESLAMISGSFMRLQKDFPPEAITVLGDSAGANYALSMCHYYKQQGLPMPGKLILLSPAMAGEKDPEILAAMRRQAPYDVMFDMQYFSSYNELKSTTEKDYLTLPMLGDFSSFPDMYIFSGTHESFYPQVLAFSERLKTENIKAEFHFGEGMMHVWPYMPLAKECLETMDTILRIIGS